MAFKKLSPLLIGLMVSVALNGIFLGLIFSQSKVDPRADRQRGGQSSDFDIGNISRSLPQEQREKFTSLLTEMDKKNMGEAFRAHNRNQRDLAALFSAETLDTNAIKLKLSDIRENRQLISILGDETLTSFLQKLSVEERRAIVQGLSERRRNNNGGNQAMSDGTRNGSGMGPNQTRHETTDNK